MTFTRLALMACCWSVLSLTVSTVRAEIPLNELTEAEKRGGWKLLFDGKTGEGWRNFKKKEMSDGWVIKDGTISYAKKGAGDILTADQYENFELVLDYKISKGGNSGLMFRVTEEEGTPWMTGPEIQIQDNVDGHDPQKAGWLYQLYKPELPAWQKQFEKQVGFASPDPPDATRPAGEWNTLYLRIDKGQCEVCMNGVTYYYFKLGDKDWDERVAKSKFSKMAKFGKAPKGHIALQDHGNEVAFRNLKIRELKADSPIPDLSDSKLALKPVLAFPNLEWDGWKAVDEEKGKVTPLRPIVLTYPGDGTDRIFVATQDGMIHTFANDPAAKQTKMFLDLRDKVADFKKDNEEGMLGLAFHPKFKENREIYLSYTSAKEPHVTYITRVKASKEDPNKAEPGEEIVMKIPQPFSNHNGGAIAFGPDGYLYIGLGDGGSRGDPLENGQSLKTWMGSILRIDVNTKQEGKNYGIPGDNPFLKRSGAQPEIYAYGFRNIWRLSFDRKTGSLWVGDVGQDLWEEIDIVKAGGNYGWKQYEGFHPYGNSKVVGEDKPIDPIWVYDHQVGKSITGGNVYRGTKVPELAGLYLYADFVTGKIWGLEYDEAAGKVKRNVGIVSGGFPVLGFGEDAGGEVYYMIEAANGKGIYKFEK